MLRVVIFIISNFASYYESSPDAIGLDQNQIL